MNDYGQIRKYVISFIGLLILCCIVIPLCPHHPAFAATAEPALKDAATPKAAPGNVPSTSGKINRNSIGCLLPLSGKYADWGKRALDAIMLAASASENKQQTAWQVVAEDSQSSPDMTKSALERLANAKNVIAIIAVTETADALETALEANKRSVPIIMITPREDVTSAGYYVFQHFLTPTQQIRAMARYAIDDLNAAIFAVLYPQDEYGEEMVKIFRRETAKIGGKVEKAIAYNPAKTDFRDEISILAGYTVKPPKVKAGQDEEREVVPVDVEALFIPDSYMKVKLIASQLDFYNIKGLPLLGTSLWNSPNLVRDGAHYLEGAVFADSFFKEGLYPETYNFVDMYREVYKRDPENIEAMAFDTAGMIFSLLDGNNIQTRQDLVAGLQAIGIYNGATGSTYFDANRVAQKTPFLLKINKGRLEQIK